MKKIGVLGSTGSIGRQTLEIVRNYKEDLEVVALAAGKSIDLLEEQIREFHPKLAVIWSEEDGKDLRERVKDTDTRILIGMEGLIEMSILPEMEMLVTAIVGMIGIRPTIAAIEAGKDIALANKETLVTAGHIIMPLIREKKVKLLPVDSEHSAIFQSLNGENPDTIEKILLTASGGPFRGRRKEDLKGMKAEDALKHPNWSMGRKITIDSATLCNKALEVMEVKWLFDVPLEKIQVLIHPQSILHSAVQYHDGAVIGQMGVPDMKLPIQYALFYPDRRPMNGGRVDFFALKQLTFEAPDPDTFEGFALGLKAAKAGGSLPTVFNAANEEAVALFLEHKIEFLEIPERIAKAMEEHKLIAHPTVEQILEAEKEAREIVR